MKIVQEFVIGNQESQANMENRVLTQVWFFQKSCSYVILSRLIIPSSLIQMEQMKATFKEGVPHYIL